MYLRKKQTLTQRIEQRGAKTGSALFPTWMQQTNRVMVLYSTPCHLLAIQDSSAHELRIETACTIVGLLRRATENAKFTLPRVQGGCCKAFS